MQVVVNVPDQFLLDISVSDLVRQLKLSTALLMFQTGQFSAGAACEFAEVDRYTFLEACQQHGINTVDYDSDELEDEFLALQLSFSESEV